MKDKFSNGIPVSKGLRKTLAEYAEYARNQGCKSTDEEIFAAFEVMIMKAAGIQPTASALRKSKKFLDEATKH